VIAWRLCATDRLAGAFTGQGAAKFPGRWNSAGRFVVYLAESRSLAALEVLAHAGDRALVGSMAWSVLRAEFDEALLSEARSLPADWDAIPAPDAARALGDRWLERKRSAVLRVPSAVTRGEFNFLVNPRHPDFAKIRIDAAQPFHFDRRIGRPEAAPGRPAG
jgi:RES domain-containing protein